MYLREVASTEPLSEEEETKLFQQLGQSSAWNDQRETIARRLIENQLSSVVRIAEKYSYSGISMVDLIQQGNLALMDALRSFALTPVGDFTGHAAARIQAAIHSFIAIRNEV